VSKRVIWRKTVEREMLRDITKVKSQKNTTGKRSVTIRQELQKLSSARETEAGSPENRGFCSICE